MGKINFNFLPDIATEYVPFFLFKSGQKFFPDPLQIVTHNSASAVPICIGNHMDSSAIWE